MPDAYLPATEFLSSIDEDWRRHIAAIGPCLHQPHAARDPYESLVRAIAYQQLHAKAGDAILGRLLECWRCADYLGRRAALILFGS